ncbi:hypothetical protein D3C71_2068750 [compost metagenome]
MGTKAILGMALAITRKGSSTFFRKPLHHSRAAISTPSTMLMAKPMTVALKVIQVCPVRSPVLNSSTSVGSTADG